MDYILYVDANGDIRKVGSEKWEEGGLYKHGQRIIRASGILQLPGTPQITPVSSTGVYPSSSYIACQAMERVVVKPMLGAANLQVKFMLNWYDTNQDLIGASNVYTAYPIALPPDGDGFYYGYVFSIENRVGASYVKVWLYEFINSGSIKMFIGAI